MFKLIGLTDNRMLIEQALRLCGRFVNSLVPTLFLLAITVGFLFNAAIQAQLAAWGAAATLSKTVCWFYARRQLARGLTADSAARTLWILLILNAMDGAIWGALPWVALEGSTLAGSVLIIAVLTGVAVNSMLLLSSVVPVFVAFICAEVGVGISKLFMMNAQENVVVGIAGFFIAYVGLLITQSVNIARSARASINLRLENAELLTKLRSETQMAETARHEAEQANLAKSKFLAAASHDLRQPVHAQNLFLDVLSRTPMTQYQNQVLESARSASQASSEMLSTLLDFSRIEAGVVIPHMQPFKMQSLLHKVENDLAPLADTKGLVYRSPETMIAVDSDAALVEMILRNLVSNAVRYTERGGVMVKCRKRDGSAVLEVWDTGIGISPENHRDIFQEFHQLGNPERDRRKGLGLGLAIADGLAKALGHKLSLTSRLGRGSVFRLRLPLSDSPVMEELAPALPNTRQLNGQRVLVVEDDEYVLSGMQLLLESWNCACDAASSINEALVLATRFTPDIIISDFRLHEEHTGAEAISRIRELLGKQIPALLVTGDTAPERLREALASRVPLLHKPVTSDALYAAIAALLDSAETPA